MSAIKSHGNVKQTADEVYGSGETILRIGNGGAGAIGLIAALANDYLSTIDREASITWVCNHSRNTQLALMNGFIDLALTYERDQEQISIDEGWAASAGCVFHDHFCLAGPVGDPAGVKNATNLPDAFRRIADARTPFLCRADFSATMVKERSIWKSVNLNPWLKENQWYIQTLYSPSQALEAAASKGAYSLTDRSTLLRQSSKGTVKNLTVFFEPNGSDSILMNSCYALFNPQTPPQRRKEIDAFLVYMLSQRGQQLIGEYGHREAGLPLFADVASGYAKASITGGQPINRKWLQQSRVKL